MEYYKPLDVRYSEYGLEIQLSCTSPKNDYERLPAPEQLFANEEIGTVDTDWINRIKTSWQLVEYFIEQQWGASDVTRTSLWRRTGNEKVPYIYVGIHGFFLNFLDFEHRRRVVLSKSPKQDLTVF